MDTLNDIMDKFRKSGFMLVFGIFSLYFIVNAIKGDRGFFKYLYLKNKVENALAERERYALIKRDLEHKVAMLSEQSLDLDYLEERAKIVLNMAGKGEYVILDKDINKR